MRLAFVSINSVAWGGSETLWTATAKRALQENNTVLVSIFDWPQLPEPIAELQKMGATFQLRRRFYPAFADRIKKKFFNIFLATGKKRTYHDYLIKFRPDHIFFSLGSGDEIALDNSDLMVLIHQISIPYSIFFHNIWFDEKEMQDSLYKNNLIECFSKAKHVFFTSKMQMENLQRILGRKFPHFEVMNHPLQNEQSAALPCPPMNPVRFALLGSLILKWKGQDIALKAFGTEEWKQRDWELHIYSSGHDEPIIRSIIAENGLENRVKFYGHIPDVSDVWRDNHIILLPSRQDSGPITLFETMLAGRTVIATRMGAIPEYINDGENGILSKDITVDSYRDALERAWARKEEWCDWGKKARETLLSKYDFHPDQTLLQKLKK